MSLSKVVILTMCIMLSACGSSHTHGDTAKPSRRGTPQASSHWIANLDPRQRAEENIKELSEKLKKNPNDIHLLSMRASWYGSEGKYNDAIRDINRALSTGHVLPELHMGKCIFMEKLGGFSDDVKHCYDDVLSIYENRDRNLPYPSMNHVFAAVMAKSPSAKRLTNKFLDNPKVTSGEKQLVESFHRSELLQSH